MLEDIENLPAADALRSYLEKLLAQGRQLLDSIDAIVDLSRSADAGRARDGVGSLGDEAAFAGLLRTLRPERHGARAQELGRILVVDDNEANRDLLAGG